MGCKSKLCAAYFIGHRYRPLGIAEGRWTALGETTVESSAWRRFLHSFYQILKKTESGSWRSGATSHPYSAVHLVEGIRHRSDFLIGEGSRSFELHPNKSQIEMCQVGTKNKQKAGFYCLCSNNAKPYVGCNAKLGSCFSVYLVLGKW